MGHIISTMTSTHEETPSTSLYEEIGRVMGAIPTARQGWSTPRESLVFIMGDGGCGKTFLLQRMLEETLMRDGTPFEFGTDHQGGYLGAYVYRGAQFTIVDAVGDDASRGTAEEITHFLCLQAAWSLASDVKVIYAINFNHIQPQTPDIMSSLLQRFAQRLANNTQAIENTVFVINRIPTPMDAEGKVLVRQFFEEMGQTTNASGMVARTICDQLDNDQVIFFDPESPQSVPKCTQRLQEVRPILPSDCTIQFCLPICQDDQFQPRLEELVQEVHAGIRHKNHEVVKYRMELLRACSDVSEVECLYRTAAEAVAAHLWENQNQALDLLKKVCPSNSRWMEDYARFTELWDWGVELQMLFLQEDDTTTLHRKIAEVGAMQGKFSFLIQQVIESFKATLRFAPTSVSAPVLSCPDLIPH